MKISVALCTYNGGKFLGEQMKKNFLKIQLQIQVHGNQKKTKNLVVDLKIYIYRNNFYE